MFMDTSATYSAFAYRPTEEDIINFDLRYLDRLSSRKMKKPVITISLCDKYGDYVSRSLYALSSSETAMNAAMSQALERKLKAIGKGTKNSS